MHFLLFLNSIYGLSAQPPSTIVLKTLETSTLEKRRQDDLRLPSCRLPINQRGFKKIEVREREREREAMQAFPSRRPTFA